jgi:hypothetical protein
LQKSFETIIHNLIGDKQTKALCDIDITSQFVPKEDTAIARNLNAAFLIRLAGKKHPLFNDATSYLDRYTKQTAWTKTVAYFDKMHTLITDEIQANTDAAFQAALETLSKNPTLENSWKLFFPQASGILENPDEKIKALRQKRKVTITKLHDKPIQDVAKEILFTSNILLTLPPASKNIDDLGFSQTLTQQLKEVAKEKQKYWYDHPIQMGVEIEKNEAIYGLIGLNEAIAYEKEQGSMPQDAKINCLLSVSVTHDGLTNLAKEYLEGELQKVTNIDNLNIFVITEADTDAIIQTLLKPAAKAYNISGIEDISEIFGVDGEYGRHYSLLKAIAALWQVLIDPKTQATFKFDLDQVFPQKELISQSGMSAFEHFKTPLWGATGLDSDNHPIELGMIAGALVNQSDIAQGLFTPDVTFPKSKATGSQYIFYSALPQALSTQAEMMLRYEDGLYDGKTNCIQRIHVTGGTNGIRIESLRKHRPFTPTFIGRAEDQAYILSVLFCKQKENLRYLHKDGLIMRHDKYAFAGESIQAAHLGKMVGDYVRILYFSHYVHALPWQSTQTKSTIDPFTGSFVSEIPFSVVALRMALETASYFAQDEEEEGTAFLKLGVQRISETITTLHDTPSYLTKRFEKEKDGWDCYYDILDALEKGDKTTQILQEKARKLIERFQVKQ